MDKKVEIFFFQSGYCTHPEFIAIKGGKISSVKFPALAVLIKHPNKGWILFDTGYSSRFYKETKSFPYKIYAMLTPVKVTESDSLVSQIQRHGVSPSNIRHIIISHFHADHIAGLKDFPESQFIYTENSFNHLKGKKGISALLLAYVPNLLPNKFSQRSITLGDKKLIQEDHFLNKYFSVIYDIFDDGSILGVELPGHAKGQLGLFLKTRDSEIFLIADACFFSKTYKNLIFPSKITNIINDDPKAYKETIQKIHRLHLDRPNIEIIPSHCMQTIKKYLN